MRKLILLSFMLIISVLVFAQDPAKESVPTDDQMVKVVKQVETAIYTLADKLKTPAENVYKVMVKAAKIDSISYLVMDILVILLIIGTILFTKWGFKEEEENYGTRFYNDEGLTLLAIVLSILSLIGLIVLTLTFSDMLQGFINPDYIAIKNILKCMQ